MIVLYMHESCFTVFIRCLCALPFLPLSRVEQAFDDLAQFEFPASNKKLMELEKARDELCQYFRSQWMEGSFPLKVWNFAGMSKNLTNNKNEGAKLFSLKFNITNSDYFSGYNSRINRIIAVVHPNMNVLLAKIVDELQKAVLEILWLKV